MDQITRRWWLQVGMGVGLGAGLRAGFGVPLALGLSAPSLRVRLDGDDLRIAAPQLHFLSGAPLEKLKDGATLVFLSQLSLSTEIDAPAIKRAVDRFAVSYDLWEQNFSVVRTGIERASAARLSPAAAEAWSLGQLAVGIDGVPPDRPLWVRLQLRAEDARDRVSPFSDSGISLTRLIELFSRPAPEQMRWEAVAGPLSLAGLKRLPRNWSSG